jgi:hypothetical protein
LSASRESIQSFSIAPRDLRALGQRGKVLAAGLEGGEEDRKRGLRIGNSAGEDIESEKSVLVRHLVNLSG